MNDLRKRVAWAAALLCCGACSDGGDKNLWRRDFPPSARITRAEVTGYWEGEISMGDVRTKIEPATITVAIRCDRDGKIVAQGAAPIAIEKTGSAKMVLQADLLSGGDEVCGFRFNKGNEFAYSLSPAGVLKINFAGSSVSELRKLSDLEQPK